MSKPTTRTRAAKLMALMRIIDNETEAMNAQRRRIAQMKREALKLIRSGS